MLMASERGKQGPRTRDEHQAADELDETDEDGQRIGGGQAELSEKPCGPRETASTPHAEELLRAVRDEHRSDGQSEHGRPVRLHPDPPAGGRFAPAIRVLCH